MKRKILISREVLWLIFYPNLKSLGLYNVSEKKITNVINMDTPQIPKKSRKINFLYFLNPAGEFFT